MILTTLVPFTLSNVPMFTPNTLDYQDEFSTIKYSVLIWNDEKHSFNDLINILENAIGYSREVGYECACRVDGIGRDVVQTSNNLEFLIQSLRFISSTGIKTSIAPAKTVFREYVATCLLTWLNNLILLQSDIAIHLKALLCDELQKDMKSTQDSHRAIKLDSLLTLSHDLWKIPIKATIQLIISTFIMNGDELKKYLATRFAILYIKISKEYCLDDKPFDLTMLSLSVQILNSPNVVNHLLKIISKIKEDKRDSEN